MHDLCTLLHVYYTIGWRFVLISVYFSHFSFKRAGLSKYTNSDNVIGKQGKICPGS